MLFYILQIYLIHGLLQLALSPYILGRTFNGIGQPIDGMGDIEAEKRVDVTANTIANFSFDSSPKEACFTICAAS